VTAVILGILGHNAALGLHRARGDPRGLDRVWLSFLNERMDIASGVLEPCNGAVLAADYPLLVRVEFGVPFEVHSAFGQAINGPVNVLDGKIENGE